MKTVITDQELVNISSFLLKIKDNYKDDPEYTSSVITLAQIMNARYAEQNLTGEERDEIIEDIVNG